MSQGETSVAIGDTAGQSSQGSLSVAIGNQAGGFNQGTNAIAIGNLAGVTGQGNYATAIGHYAGRNNQGTEAVAIGRSAGGYTQGTNAIAIGQNAGTTNQDANSIVINATGNHVASAAASSTVIIPLRLETVGTNRLMIYNTGTGELTYSSANTASSKTFVIDHPIDESKYLVHACLEGPESGVYYRGRGKIESGVCEITLPNYVNALAADFTVHITPVRAAVKGTRMYVEVSDIDEKGQFITTGDDGIFSWIVYGSRSKINVEPNKSDVKVKGDGPYKWYENM